MIRTLQQDIFSLDEAPNSLGDFDVLFHGRSFAEFRNQPPPAQDRNYLAVFASAPKLFESKYELSVQSVQQLFKLLPRDGCNRKIQGDLQSIVDVSSDGAKLLINTVGKFFMLNLDGLYQYLNEVHNAEVLEQVQQIVESQFVSIETKTVARKEDVDVVVRLPSLVKPITIPSVSNPLMQLLLSHEACNCTQNFEFLAAYGQEQHTYKDTIMQQPDLLSRTCSQSSRGKRPTSVTSSYDKEINYMTVFPKAPKHFVKQQDFSVQQMQRILKLLPKDQYNTIWHDIQKIKDVARDGDKFLITTSEKHYLLKLDNLYCYLKQSKGIKVMEQVQTIVQQSTLDIVVQFVQSRKNEFFYDETNLRILEIQDVTNEFKYYVASFLFDLGLLKLVGVMQRVNKDKILVKQQIFDIQRLLQVFDLQHIEFFKSVDDGHNLFMLFQNIYNQVFQGQTQIKIYSTKQTPVALTMESSDPPQQPIDVENLIVEVEQKNSKKSPVISNIQQYQKQQKKSQSVRQHQKKVVKENEIQIVPDPHDIVVKKGPLSHYKDSFDLFADPQKKVNLQPIDNNPVKVQVPNLVQKSSQSSCEHLTSVSQVSAQSEIDISNKVELMQHLPIEVNAETKDKSQLYEESVVARAYIQRLLDQFD